MTRGWWRRNLWGLILVVPMTAGLFAINADGLYEANIRLKPRDPVPVDGGGTAVLDDLRVSLESFGSVSADDPDLAEESVTLPGSVTAWRVVVTFDGPDDQLSACSVGLVDERDRVYSSKSLGALGAVGCQPDEFDAPTPYQTTFYFLLPQQTRPQALQIYWLPLLPRYVRIPVEA
jgi:hypothetical protein